MRDFRRKNVKVLSLFAGIGGFDLAAQYLGWETAAAIEIDPFCQLVFRKNFPHAEIFSDVTTYHPRTGEFDIVTFGSPCQDLSVAGKQAGLVEGDRSSLFFEAIRIIREAQPRGFVFENVTGAIKWLPEILGAFAEIGLYECVWFTLSCSEIGGVHKRERLFVVGVNTTYPRCNGCDSRERDREGRSSPTDQKWISTESKQAGDRGQPGISQDGQTSQYPQSQRWAAQGSLHDQTWANSPSVEPGDRPGEGVEPSFCLQYDGLPVGLARCLMSQTDLESAISWASIDKTSDRAERKKRQNQIKALGNAVTPQQAWVALDLLRQMLQC